MVTSVGCHSSQPKQVGHLALGNGSVKSSYAKAERVNADVEETS